MKVSVSGKHTIDVLFQLALLLAFLARSLLVTALAANGYRNTAQQSQKTQTARMVAAYTAEKIHQNDRLGAVYLQTLEDAPVLVLEQEQDGQTYCTCIYLHDGMLRELMVRKGTEITPDRGRQIMALKDFQAEQIRDDLFHFVCTDEENRTADAFVAVQSHGR